MVAFIFVGFSRTIDLPTSKEEKNRWAFSLVSLHTPCSTCMMDVAEVTAVEVEEDAEDEEEGEAEASNPAITSALCTAREICDAICI